jgi:hypothetical protein
MVVIHLHKALPWSQFAAIMGPALKSTEEEKLGFDLSSLPAEWTRYAPAAGNRKKSRPSRRQKGFEITKEANRASYRQGGGGGNRAT